MSERKDTTAVRTWIIDYLVEQLGCDRASIAGSAPLVDLGVGSKDAVVMAGELGEFVGHTISPVEFWDHPTIDQLAAHLTGHDSENLGDAPAAPRSGGDSTAGNEPIAVVGLACRLAGETNDPEALWDLLCAGNTAVGEVPVDRWAPWDDGTERTGDALGRTTRTGAFLGDISRFDAEFFDISPVEAAAMDPQQRMLLEVAWEALERSGIPPRSLGRTRTGVFVGACVSEYGYLATSDLSAITAWSNTGGALSIIANRLSYLLDLRGPSMTIDTACSSSLVALHLAAQSLRTGESDAALVGGVNLLLSPSVFHGFDESGALSPTGTCRAFDADANGFVRGEGCGVVVVKRLSDAQRDGDNIMAVIRGSAVNQDGLSNGMFAPNPAAQMQVLRSAYSAAGVHPRDVDYVEAHGTGTPLGDPIEARALGNVLGRGRPASAPLLVGSVKPNVGHLEGAAGIVGLIKTVLALHTGELPPTPHYSTPNPHIPFDQLRIAVVAERQPWPTVDRPRRAGVSSFGFGGTNAHVVLEQAPAATPAAAPHAAPVATPHPVTTLTISGKTPDRLATWADSLADWFEGPGAGVPLPNVAHALAHRRPDFPVSASVIARDTPSAVSGLRAIAANEQHDAITPAPKTGNGGSGGSGGTVFVFSGQGAQWPGMASRLLTEEPEFAAAVDRLAPQFQAHTGFSLRETLESRAAFGSDRELQPTLVGVQLALVELWRHYGVEPDAVIGHSVGEITAAIVAGALTVDAGLRVVATRGRLMSELGGTGAVALLGATEDTAAELIADHSGVEIAVHASPRQTGIAGPVSGVEAVLAAASERNVFARRVDMAVASHTAMMDPVLARLENELESLAPSAPKLPFYSTVFETDAPRVDAAYWVANVRRPVQLHRALAAAAQQNSTFIEISAHPVLQHAITDSVPAEASVVGTLVRDGDDTVSFRRAVAAVRPPRSNPRTDQSGASAADVHYLLPTNPWHHERHWLAGTSRPRPADSASPLNDTVPAQWQYRLDWAARPCTSAEHSLTGTWAVVGDGAAASELADALGADTIAATEFATPHTVPAAAALKALGAADHVVYAPAPSTDPLDPAAGYARFAACRAVVTAIAAVGVGRLHLVTRNGQPTTVGDRADPAHAVLWGAGRTIALEHPAEFGGLLDVDASVPPTIVADYLRREVAEADHEDQVVYRAGVRHVPRLRAGSPALQPHSAAPTDSDGVDPDGAHLVVGATGNLGPTLIRELVRRGARTIVAVSRNPEGRLDRLADELDSAGARMIVVAADAADEVAMAVVIRRFGDDLPPLAGVYLAAFGGGPVTLAQMTDDDVTAMFAPKLDAVAVLDRLTRARPPAHFMLFTSISGLTGSRWLGHYAATTTYLDAFAYARRAAGLPATAINWGLWKSLHDSQDAVAQETTEGSGLTPMDDETAIRGIGAALGSADPIRTIVVAADWPRLAAAYRVHAPLRIVDELAADPTERGAEATAELRITLADAPAGARHAILADAVADIVAAALGLESRVLLDREAGFFQAGMDSLTVVTVARTLSRALGEELPTSVVFDYPSADALTAYLVTVLPELADSESAAADPGPADPATDDYDDLSENELLAQLAERLT